MPQRRRRIVIAGAAVLILALVVYGFMPEATTVEVAQARYGPLQVMVEEEGVTQVADRFVISAPTTAYARRVELEVGDAVEAGQVLVRLEPPRAVMLDPRSRTQAQARVEAAEAALVRARQQREAAAALAERAADERQRAERLVAQGSATQQMEENAVAEARQARAHLDAAEAAVVAARAELAAARAALQDVATAADVLDVEEVLRAPATGRVLAVHQQSAGMVSPGQPLLEIGDTRSLEVRVDVLSQDAVRLTPGTRVLFDQWGGDQTLEGVVERTEPQGFTQVSSLGVEEQRVTVVADLTSPQAAWASLGAGYRVLARFVVWEDQDVLQVPTSALFRTDDGWAVFTVVDGAAVPRAVEVGHRTGLRAQIVGGLEEDAVVIAQPDNDMEEGARVEPRSG